ncbi:BfmA/BtgA family mobilization protein [Pedobacter polysacchareus]|uniref:BfmA/BtgA family mobilization protein n=1 Tax=Pedobacter polysacchareus TaxID=2861973 RepID=UPI001C9938F8|nr:BfmA/BtgA family mobilization protein [Pedobacter polysacchareus]
MQEEQFRTVKYSLAVDLKFDKIALKLGRAKRLLFIQMVEYFYRNKKDPADFNDELLKNTLLKQHQQYIGFIKVQESEYFDPIRVEINRMAERQRNLLNLFNTQVLKSNEQLFQNQNEMLSQQQMQIAKFSQTDSLIARVEVKLYTKERLKQEFAIILENYVKAREALGLMFSGKEKEALLTKVMAQVKGL